MPRPLPVRLAAAAMIVFWAHAVPAAAGAAQRVQVASPDGRLALTVRLVSPGPEDGRVLYDVGYDGKTILEGCRLGLLFKDGPAMDNGFTAAETRLGELHDETWRPVYGERSEIRDRYRPLAVELKHGAQGRRLRIEFRVYDEGVAFRYTIPRQPVVERFTIAAENTRFRFTGNHVAWPVYSAQGVYTKATLDKIKPNCERPLVVDIEGGPYVAVGEARLVDYARMRLMPAGGEPHTLQSMLAGQVTATAPYTTPWRFILVGDTPGQLLERNHLLSNLNEPCALADTSWIKPGKVIREVTLTTEGGKACVDFAVKMGLQYIEYDAGWYGHEYDDASDATTVTRDPNKSGTKGTLDLQEVIHYAEQRGIGVLVYVNRRQLERQLDEILPLYQKWGIKGVKYGFVQVGSQQWTAWLHEAVRKAAQHRLMVDIHDEYRPTGYSRTYPNLMTQEGIRGNECMPPAGHNCILPFTRMLCGAGDYTVCWYTPRIQTTHAHQLACPVVFYSPWQFLFWYDRPQQCQGEQELEFFKNVPVTWDETRVLDGRIGEYVVIARRKGREWYVGTLNALKRRSLETPLTFLEPGRNYTADIYSDAAPEGGKPFEVTIARRTVDSQTVIPADMAANGGQAIRIVPDGP